MHLRLMTYLSSGFYYKEFSNMTNQEQLIYNSHGTFSKSQNIIKQYYHDCKNHPINVLEDINFTVKH